MIETVSILLRNHTGAWHTGHTQLIFVERVECNGQLIEEKMGLARLRQILKVTVGVPVEVGTGISLTSRQRHSATAEIAFLQHCSQYQYLTQVCGRFPLFIVSVLLWNLV